MITPMKNTTFAVALRGLDLYDDAANFENARMAAEMSVTDLDNHFRYGQYVDYEHTLRPSLVNSITAMAEKFCQISWRCQNLTEANKMLADILARLAEATPTVPIQELSDDMLAWLGANIAEWKTIVGMDAIFVAFRNDEDAMQFRLRWCVEPK